MQEFLGQFSKFIEDLEQQEFRFGAALDVPPSIITKHGGERIIFAREIQQLQDDLNKLSDANDERPLMKDILSPTLSLLDHVTESLQRISKQLERQNIKVPAPFLETPHIARSSMPPPLTPTTKLVPRLSMPLFSATTPMSSRPSTVADEMVTPDLSSETKKDIRRRTILLSSSSQQDLPESYRASSLDSAALFRSGSQTAPSLVPQNSGWFLDTSTTPRHHFNAFAISSTPSLSMTPYCSSFPFSSSTSCTSPSISSRLPSASSSAMYLLPPPTRKHQIPLVEESAFETLPSFITRQLTFPLLNQAIAAINVEIEKKEKQKREQERKRERQRMNAMLKQFSRDLSGGGAGKEEVDDDQGLSDPSEQNEISFSTEELLAFVDSATQGKAVVMALTTLKLLTGYVHQGQIYYRIGT